MPLNKKTTAIAVAAGVLALGAGIGAAQFAQADPTPTPGTPSASPSTGAPKGPDGRGPGGRGPGGPGGHGHGPGGVLGGDFAKQLASKLGVSEAKVTEALKAVRDANRPTQPKPSASPSASPTAPPARPDPAEREAALVKALAEKLGIDEAKVKAAIDAIEADHNAERAAALKTRLDAAVKAGTLTQAEADAVTKAVKAGVIGGGFGPR